MIHSMKKGLLVIGMLTSLTLLSACGSEENTDQTFNVYDGESFTINVPNNWDILPPSEFYESIPKETLIAFTAPEELPSGFMMNVNIVKEEDLPKGTLSGDYGQANIQLAKELTDYSEIQQRSLANGTVHIFNARVSPSRPALRLIQLYVIEEKEGKTNGYIVSGGVPVDTPDETRDLLGATVTSFQIKESIKNDEKSE